VLCALLRMEPNRSAWRFLEKEKVMVTIKVKDGTPESRGTLCTTCRSARVVKGYRAGEMEVFCGASYPERRVRFLVAECTAYDDTRIVSRCDMEKIAWILVTKPRDAASASSLRNSSGRWKATKRSRDGIHRTEVERVVRSAA